MKRRWLVRLVLLICGVALLAGALGVFIFQRLEVVDQDRVIRYLPFLLPLRATEIPFRIPTPPLTASLDFSSLLTPDAPLATPTATPTPLSAIVHVGYQVTPTPISIQPPIPARYRLQGLRWEPQKFNNCGPANLVQAMGFYGWTDGQDVVASALKPDQQDKNVGPHELADYVNSRTNGYLRAIVRTGGDIALVRRLVANQFAVLLETGFYDRDAPQKGWIGHYLTIVGYDDEVSRLYKLDTYKGETSERYDVLDELWSHFNRLYIVVYPSAREGELMALLGANWDEDYNRRSTLDRAREAAAAQPNNPFAWFNLGSSFTALGRYAEGALAFDRAFSLPEPLPIRMLWYQFAPFEAYYRNGNYRQAIALAESVIESAKGYVEEAFYYRGIALAALGLWDEAYADVSAAVRFNPNFSAAVRAMNLIRGRQLP
ncbi:MAG: tetratricopeptide repeat protein [Aggregatilineales bacterium]